MVSWRINSTKVSNKLKLNKMNKITITEPTKPCTIHDVSGSVFRPKNGHELLQALKENKQCEQNRQKGLYKNMPNELEKVKNLSAEYQQTLFSYTNVGGFA